MIRDKLPEYKTMHGKPRYPQFQGSVERINKDIKKILGSLMRKSIDQFWVKYLNQPTLYIKTQDTV